MKKIATFDDLYDELTRSFTWRIKEISTLRKTLERSDRGSAAALGRACAAMLYAHWEGYIKNASESYLKFIAARNIRYEDLIPCFFYLVNERSVAKIRAAGSSSADRIEACHQILQSRQQRRLTLRSQIVGTRSNLNSEVLAELCVALGLEIRNYQADFIFIDKILVERRNYVAHGEEVHVDVGEFRDSSDRAISLMRRYKNDVENAAVSEAYMI